MRRVEKGRKPCGDIFILRYGKIYFFSFVPRHEFSDEKKEEVSKTLVRVDKRTVVRINFYLNGHYIDIEGTVAKNNVVYHYLTIGQKKIFYDDIYQIDIVSE